MRKLLICGGSPILNFKDLQSRFSPTTLYARLGTFCDFSAIHCVPLPLQLIDGESGKRYNAEYITKQFWQQMLRRMEWPKQAKSAEACLDFLLQDALLAEEKEQGLQELSQDDEKLRELRQESMKKEVSDAKLYDKLRFIAKTGAADGDHRKAILLLAISELAEVDVLKTGVGDWEEPQPPKAGDASAPQKAGGASEVGPVLFPYDHTAYLTAASQAYKYWYHDEDVLAPGAEIRTVKVTANAGGNQYTAVQIELYSTKTKQCLDKITLKNGEYRYCSVSQGRIIKFLPCVSISDDLCLVRPEYDKSDIQVLSSGAEAWTLNGENISSFSADKANRGFLLIQDGRINFQFFKGAEDFFSRLTLEMITIPAVEVCIRQDGYEVLLSDGTTIAENPARKRAGIPTLDLAGRYPLPTVTNLPGCKEVAFSESRSSVAVLNNKFSQKNVRFAGKADGLQIREGAAGVVITL